MTYDKSVAAFPPYLLTFGTIYLDSFEWKEGVRGNFVKDNFTSSGRLFVFKGVSEQHFPSYSVMYTTALYKGSSNLGVTAEELKQILRDNLAIVPTTIEVTLLKILGL